MHAPLTGVFLIAELTGGYDLFLPLMIVSIGSYITILMFEPHSIYSMRLAQKGELLTHHKDKAVLTLLSADNVIERDFQVVSPEMTLGDMVKVIARSSRNTFPVVDDRGILLGIVLLDNIRNIMFRPELYNRFHVSKFMVSAPAKIVVNTPMDQIMQIFDDTKAWNLPVVDETGRYMGFMSKSKIFNMKKEDLRIVYMGTPEFAVECLRALVEHGYQVVGVVTMPDKPMGRHGSVLQSSAVKKYAESVGLPILQPEKLKDEAFLEALRAWNADLQIVVAFRMLPEVVWNMPRLGTFNLHASLLPRYRGAAPINWAIINGDTKTGVTTFFLDHEIDTGSIIMQETCPIADTDDAGNLHDNLMALGAQTVLKSVDQICEGNVVPFPQKDLFDGVSEFLPAPKIFKETCRIDWNKPLKNLYDFVRGLSPYPAAWTELVTRDGKRQVLKIYQTEKRPEQHCFPVGTIQSDGKSFVDVAVDGGFLRLQSVQLAGKKRMSVTDFLNGFKQIAESHVE